MALDRKNICPTCHYEMIGSYKFCPNCGTKLINEEAAAIDAAMRDLFDEKSVEPKLKTAVEEKVIQKPKPPVKKAEKESKLVMAIGMIAVLLVAFIVVGGGYMFMKLINEEESTIKPPMTSEIENGYSDSEKENPDNLEQGEKLPAVDGENEAMTDSDENESNEKESIEVAFKNDLGQLSDLVTMEKITVSSPDEDNYRFTFEYTSETDLSLLFYDVKNGFNIPVDAPASYRSLYFDVAKDKINPEIPLVLSFTQIAEDDTLPAGSGFITIEADALTKILEEVKVSEN